MGKRKTAARTPVDEPESPRQKMDAETERKLKRLETAAANAPSKAEQIARLDQAHEDVKTLDEARLIRDYDEAYDELRARTEQLDGLIRFEGRDWTVPASMPADFGIFYIRHCISQKSPGGQYNFAIPEKRIPEFFRLLLGERFAQAVERSKKPLPWVIDNIVRDVFRHWGIELGGAPTGTAGASQGNA